MPATILLVATLLISLGDVLINVFGLCCTGRCKLESCCFNFEHEQEPTSPIQTLSNDDIQAMLERRKSV
jgi:hypothetical protein